MILLELNGGLGNQMFQYAHGRSLSIRKNQQLRYYFVHHAGDTDRRYELDNLNIKGKKRDRFFVELLANISKLFGLDFPNVISGYWQNPKYFSGHEEEIREDFRFVNPLDQKNRKILKKIRNTNSVSIHIRRGDYISDEKTSNIHGICSKEYYLKAIRHINKKVKNPFFLFFSDEMDWVRDNFKIDNAIYVDWNTGKESFKDMQLMTNCKHNIIANSSFSWWGAWLNNNSSKIVIAPKNWFNDKKYQKETNNLVPTKWLRN